MATRAEGGEASDGAVETRPGQQLQIDFGEVRVWIAEERVRMHLFVATLGYSRRMQIKTEVINALGPWPTFRDVEWQTLKWIDWYNNRRLLAPIGYIPPAEAESAYFANQKTLYQAA